MPEPTATPSPTPTPAPTPTPRATTATAGKHTDGTRYVSYGNGEVRTGGTASWRNNNPGNLEAGAFAKRHGAIGKAGRFAVFPDAETGREAKASLIKGQTYEGKTLAEVIEKYAPGPENDPKAYADFIADKAGIETSSVISDLDDNVVNDIVDAMKTYEGWEEGGAYAAGDPNAPDWVRDLFPPGSASGTPSDASVSSDSSDDRAPAPSSSSGPGGSTSSDEPDTSDDDDTFPNRDGSATWFRP